MIQQCNPIKKQMGEKIVNKKYTIHHHFYEGQFSNIYSVIFQKKSRQIARVIKLELTMHNKSNSTNLLLDNKKTCTNKIKLSHHGLRTQINVLKKIYKTRQVPNKQILDEAIGFPRIYECGSEKGTNYMVLEMYGPNLAQLMRLCGGNFSLKTTILIGLQIIDRIQTLHNQKYIYNNFMPQNFVVGLGSQSFLIFMIDFGKASIYKSNNTNTHIPYSNKQQNISELQNIFASVNLHQGIRQSRRDDIEAYIYMLVYLFKGKLPWSKVEGKTKKQRDNYILDIKQKIAPQSLMRDMPIQFCDLLWYTKTLSFYQKPDYEYIRRKLWTGLMESNFEELRNNIIIYDWSNRQDIDYEIYRDIPAIKLSKDTRRSKFNNDSESNNDDDYFETPTYTQKQTELQVQGNLMFYQGSKVDADPKDESMEDEEFSKQLREQKSQECGSLDD